MSRRDDGMAWNATAAAASEEGEDIRQDLQEDRRAGDRKANSQVFHWATGSE
jgi:hypothetical protein